MAEAPIISIFNNKGGVGKTTYVYHIAHLLAKKKRTVLLVDCDSQCNLTAYCLSDSQIENSWKKDGNSIYRVIEPVYRTIGDIRKKSPTAVDPKKYATLYIVPGDLLLTNFEDALGNTWNGAKGGSEPELRPQSAIYRYIQWAKGKIGADVVFVDLGPNLGALNRAVLGASDYFIVPIAPDLFSIRGTENLGSKLVSWRNEWDQVNAAWTGEDLTLPAGRPKFMGYVVQQHNLRNNSDGMTRGWKIFGDRMTNAINKNIVAKLEPLNQAVKWNDGSAKLGQIPNLHSLIPYSLSARKPVFDCRSSDGLRGEHISKAKDSASLYDEIIAAIEAVLP